MRMRALCAIAAAIALTGACSSSEPETTGIAPETESTQEGPRAVVWTIVAPPDVTVEEDECSATTDVGVNFLESDQLIIEDESGAIIGRHDLDEVVPRPVDDACTRTWLGELPAGPKSYIFEVGSVRSLPFTPEDLAKESVFIAFE